MPELQAAKKSADDALAAIAPWCVLTRLKRLERASQQPPRLSAGAWCAPLRSRARISTTSREDQFHWRYKCRATSTGSAASCPKADQHFSRRYETVEETRGYFSLARGCGGYGKGRTGCSGCAATPRPQAWGGFDVEICQARADRRNCGGRDCR